MTKGAGNCPPHRDSAAVQFFTNLCRIKGDTSRVRILVYVILLHNVPMSKHLLKRIAWCWSRVFEHRHRLDTLYKSMTVFMERRFDYEFVPKNYCVTGQMDAADP